MTALRKLGRIGPLIPLLVLATFAADGAAGHDADAPTFRHVPAPSTVSDEAAAFLSAPLDLDRALDVPADGDVDHDGRDFDHDDGAERSHDHHHGAERSGHHHDRRRLPARSGVPAG